MGLRWFLVLEFSEDEEEDDDEKSSFSKFGSNETYVG